jgi:hypothetical protein
MPAPVHTSVPVPEDVPAEDVGPALAGVLEALVQQGQGEAAALLGGLEGQIDLGRVFKSVDALDPEHFHLLLSWPVEQIAQAVLASRGQENARAIFIFTHYSFVERHLKGLFYSFEGMSCCADKSRWAARALLLYFAHGKAIVLNMEQEYTFHLPKRVLNTQEQLLEMFEGLYTLHCGKPEKYLMALSGLTALATATALPLNEA